jgi:thiol:disulfide interchange protein DsbA
MKRRSAYASALLATAIFASVALAAAPTSIGKWQAGTNYTLLEKPQPPQVARGKVQVNEVFWYGCGHCYALDPALEKWNSDKPAYIEFVRTPVMWGPMHRQHAKIFYTIQALNRTDLHAKVFTAIHHKNNILAAQKEEQARALHLAFFKDHGVTEQAFNEAYDSAAVTAGLVEADQVTRSFAVGSVPLLIVQGKYTTGVSQAGGEKELLNLINDLAKSEKRR